MTEAEEFAIQACDITIDDETGESSFSGYSDSTMKAYDETQEKVLEWRDRAEQASSAAALDTTFEPLRTAALTVYDMKDKAVKAWQRNEPSIEDFFNDVTGEDIELHNSSLAEYNVECSSLSNRLNTPSS